MSDSISERERWETAITPSSLGKLFAIFDDSPAIRNHVLQPQIE